MKWIFKKLNRDNSTTTMTTNNKFYIVQDEECSYPRLSWNNDDIECEQLVVYFKDEFDEFQKFIIEELLSKGYEYDCKLNYYNYCKECGYFYEGDNMVEFIECWNLVTEIVANYNNPTLYVLK